MGNISKWSTKDSPFYWAFAIYKQLGLTIVSVLFSFGTLAGWYVVAWRNGIRLEPHDMEQLLLLTGALSVLALLFIGGLAYTKVTEKKDKIVDALMMEDRLAAKRQFLRYRDERTANSTLVFLGTAACAVILHAALIPWGNVYAGIAGVFTTSFISSKFWVLVTHFDDAIDSSKWIRDRTPEEWLTEDVDRFFMFGTPQHAGTEASA